MANKKTPPNTTAPNVGDEIQVRYLENPNAIRTVARAKVTAVLEGGLLDVVVTRPDRKGELRLTRLAKGDAAAPMAGALPRWEPSAQAE